MKKYTMRSSNQRPKKLPQAGIIYAIRSQDIIAISDSRNKNNSNNIIQTYNSNNNKAITTQSNTSLDSINDNTDSDIYSNELSNKRDIEKNKINRNDDSHSTVSLSTENIMEHLFVSQDSAKTRKLSMTVNRGSIQSNTETSSDTLKQHKPKKHVKLNSENETKFNNYKIKHTSTDKNKTSYQISSPLFESKYQHKHLSKGDDGLDDSMDCLVERKQDELLLSFQDVSLELSKMKVKYNELSLENSSLKQMTDNLTTQINNLRHENSSVKTRNETLAARNLENQNLSRIVECLNKRIRDMAKETEDIQNKDSDKSIKIVELEKKLADAQEKSSLTLVEIEYLKDQLAQKEIELKRLQQNQKQDESKDLQMKMIHNELIELKGNIRVICRIKPESNNLITVINNETLQLPSLKTKSPLIYNYNKILRPNSSQQDVFNEVKQLITSFVDGYNVSMITYGQSGTGKTYTMLGSSQEPGIICHSIREIFKLCQQRSSWTYKVGLSVLEIYNEVIYDLLATVTNTNQNCSKTNNYRKRTHIHDDGKCIHIKGLSEVEIQHEEDLLIYINKSSKLRSCGITCQNSDSSRSHFIVMLRIYGKNLFQNCTTQGVLMLCDLAGSENCSNTLVDMCLTESKYISKSLTVLGRVFEALYNRQSPVIPFRDSKLTHILKPSLTGEAKFAFIVTVSGQLENLSSSFRALNLAKKVAQISLGQAKKNQIHQIGYINSNTTTICTPPNIVFNSR